MEKDLLKDPESEKAVEVLKKHLKGRADSYEIFLSSSKGVSVESRDRAVDAFKVKSGKGVGLRTISRSRLGFAFSSVLKDEALREMADRALEGSLSTAEDPSLTFPKPAKPALREEDLGVFDGGFYGVSEEEKIRVAVGIEEAARSYDRRVARVRKASFSETLSSVRVVNSNGVDLSSAATFYSGSVTAVAEEGGESQMGWELELSHMKADVDPSRVGKGAARRAVELLGAKKIKTVRCPAVVENMMACELLEAISSSFLADNVEKGKSMLAGKTGERVASRAVNVYDDGILKGGWASSVFDGEGALKRRTPLLAEGVLRNYLYDAYWAARTGKSSTGNSSRPGFKALPTVGISNLYIEPGTAPLEELFKGMGKGFFITELLGVHTVNTISGDFSLGASGFWVEGGVAAYPVRGMAIAGNLLQLFSRVEACASDMRFIGSIGSPSLLISEIEASGA